MLRCSSTIHLLFLFIYYLSIVDSWCFSYHLLLLTISMLYYSSALVDTKKKSRLCNILRSGQWLLDHFLIQRLRGAARSQRRRGAMLSLHRPFALASAGMVCPLNNSQHSPLYGATDECCCGRHNHKCLVPVCRPQPRTYTRYPTTARQRVKSTSSYFYHFGSLSLFHFPYVVFYP